MGWVEVWVDHVAAQDCYTYGIPVGLTVEVGDILTVPFGSQSLAGIAVRLLDHPPNDLEAEQIRPIQAVVDQGLLPAHFWPLIHQVAYTYVTPMAQVLRTILPPGLLSRSQRRVRLGDPSRLDHPWRHPESALLLQLLHEKKDLSWRYLRQRYPLAQRALQELLSHQAICAYWQDAPHPKPQTRVIVMLLATAPEIESLTPRQQEVLGLLKRQGGELPLSTLLTTAKTTRALIQTLVAKGSLQLRDQEILRSPAQPQLVTTAPLPLSTAQQTALTAISTLPSGACLLLHGVTGAGKTEVYLQAIAQVLQRGQSALVLVPEIGLTPQMMDRFRGRFGEHVLSYHSGLSDGERYDAWRQVLLPSPRVIVGTRSAIFIPIPNLGMIILDEEHDDSYKQDQPQPCYHARTVAQWRAKLSPCPLVLGTATPALETWQRTQVGEIGLVSLAERINPQPLPPIQIIDLREELYKGNRSPFSYALRQALLHLPSGEQAILFLPRRGYSTFVSCRACGEVVLCPHCDVSLTFHQVGSQLRCHYCGYGRDPLTACPACGSPYLKDFGTGTQKIVEALAQAFPHLRILRYDRDTTQRKGSHRAILEAFTQGEADVLVGTQMITKGIDIPQVTVVGILAADGLLHQTDFRATERTFQILTQVAGRAGRGLLPGQVILQTYSPTHATIAAIQRYDYPGFAHQEIQERQAAEFPPWCRVIVVRFKSRDPQYLPKYAARLVEHFAGIPVITLGPAPALVERVNGWYRWHWLLKIPLADPTLEEAIWLKLQGLPIQSQIQFSIDVDPLHIQ